DLMRVQARATIQEGEFDQERATRHLAPSLFDEFATCLHGAASRQNVIDQKYPGPGADPIDMDMKLGTAVLQIILVGVGPVGRLPRLSQGDERLAHSQGHGSGKEKPASLGRRDGVDLLPGVMLHQLLYGVLERLRLRQERRNVFEK